MKKKYIENGYSIKNLFDHKELDYFLESIHSFTKIQINKIGYIPKKNLYQNLLLLKKKNIKALEEALLMARNSKIGHQLAANKNVIKASSDLLNAKEKKLVISGPGVMINFSKSQSGKYTYHAEQNWYPKRRNFTNIWCPVNYDRTKLNSMKILLKSHKKDWYYFSEYTGYDGKFNNTSLVQYEIPKNFLKGYKEKGIEIKVGQGLFFSPTTVHRSVNTTSNKIYITMIFRVYDYTNDATLSSNWADIPYNRKSFGYPDIKIH